VALKHLSVALIVVLIAAGCRGDVPPAEPDALEGLSVTRWTEKTELFAEFAPLVVGETSRFAIHLTRLDTFKALTSGHVEVRIRGGSAPEEIFQVEGPSRPGIFGVDVKPAHAGKRELVILLRSQAVTDDQVVGEVNVHANLAAAKAAAETTGDEAPGISFLKEQQWTLDFGTAVVREASLRESIRVPARVEARPGGAADVVASIDGRLTSVAEVPAGGIVSQGQILARLFPSPQASVDLSQLQREVSEARLTVAQAVHDRERAERLTAAGAAPARRLEEARLAESQAQVRLTSAEARLSQFHAARSGGAASEDAVFVLRSPVDGVIAERSAVTGANVVAGTVLFRVIDAAMVHVVGQIPESDAMRARTVTAAELEIASGKDRVPAGRRVSIGNVLDPRSRTLPMTFAFDNRRLAMPVGQSIVLYLLMNSTEPGSVVPTAAVVDDAGRPIVFVQREGETFERRAITLGTRSGGLVQVREGLKPGERIVTKGAFLVRLAALSTTVPAHGHVH
jgi:cobalt-zinc-cadmium efflux system membrane fusion protein